MGLFSNRVPPNLPNAPKEYDSGFFDNFTKVLRLYFTQISAVQQVNVATMNIDIDQLPTQADLASLRSGDIYRDTSASNVLKIKP